MFASRFAQRLGVPSVALAALPLALMLATACPADEGDGDSANDSVADTVVADDGAETATAGTMPGDTAAASDGPVADSTDAAGDDGMLGPCEPTADEDDCGMCVKDSCCTELEACAADTGCTCFRACAEEMGQAMFMVCAEQCMVDVLDTTTISGQLSSCTVSMCPQCLG